MRKVYISNWNHGDYNENENVSRSFLLNRFVREFKFFNSDIQLVFVGNSSSISFLEDVSNIEIIELPDDHTHDPSQWPLVKVNTIINHSSGSILHLDYDFFMRYDLNHLFDWLESNNCDVLYQTEEFLTRPLYKKILKEKPHYKELFSDLTHKVAYNAGITYFSENACNFLRNLEIPNDLLDDDFACGLFWEQVFIPSKLIQNNFVIHTLNHILDDLPESESQYQNLNDTNSLVAYNQKIGLFLPKIGTYHFCGPTWKFDDTIDMLKHILYLSEIDTQ